MELASPNIPGQPHRWADEIKAWADGRLVQWRSLRLAASNCHAPWVDCLYPSCGRPEWENTGLEFRIAPETPELRRRMQTTKLVNRLGATLRQELGEKAVSPHLLSLMHSEAAGYLDSLEMEGK